MLRVTRHQHSLKYAHHVQLAEMRQPDWTAKKFHGSSYDYNNLARDKVRGNTLYARIMRSHMNLWHTDLDPSTNVQMAQHATMEKYHTLLGRTSHHAAAGVMRISNYSDAELNMDQRYKGAQRNAIVNLLDEPFWNSVMYPLSTLRQRSAPDRDYSAAKGVGLITLADLTPDGIPATIRPPVGKKDSSTAAATYQLMTIKTKEHVDAYWKNLQHIIKVNRLAVGDIGEAFQSRNIRHAHQAFVQFQDAIRSHDFQDSYLIRHMHETRPKELTDIFGISLEMEANYVNHDFCPRCSLPFATTRFCGEGDAQTPFRTNRGRWAPHKSWGKEWYDVVVRRAEQLWYRATEDPLFGTASHTQKQAESLLKVYCKTQSRGKAIHFLTSLRGSLEFIQNKIKITDAMQKDIDALMDETPHPHLLTNGFRAQPNGASLYLLSATNSSASAAQKATTLPLSPMQFRIDLEMNKIRREQKEQGAIRLPPKGWRINTENIQSYKVGTNGKVTNWRAVKEGIEKSFLDSGLPREAYTAGELREMAYLNHHLATRDSNKAAFKAAFEAERDAARRDGLLNKNKVVFPTADYYQLFDTTEAAFAPFSGHVSEGGSKAGGTKLRFGTQITGERAQYQDQKNVHIALATSTFNLDTTDAACSIYGFLHGQIVTYKEAESQNQMMAIVLGVDRQGSNLIAVDRNGAPVELGYDIENIHQNCQGIAKTNEPRRSPNVMSNLLRYTESFANGTIIGVREGELFVSWEDGVAVSLGNPKAMLAAKWTLHPTGAAATSQAQVREPYSWVTPFRNDWSEERLEELKRAPWNRERYVSIIQNKFTPVVKRFGYTQHITQDDFVTKEYRDRLTSKQFFASPQSFEVIPDVQVESVRFGGKEEVATRLHGLPSADRNELENGWEEVPDVSLQEVAAIEQGLKDISGKRPGNYIKSAAEIGSLKLNESWWAPINWGWQQQQREQTFLENSADRKVIDPSKAAFGGQFPAFGTTYGIGERLRDITTDFAKGFGPGGPHAQNPLSDSTNINTLGFESTNAELLGYSNVVLRLFNEKVGDQSVYNVAEQLAAMHKADPRNVLLSLNEWRTAGRNPSPVLGRILADYLRDEISAYNATAVDGADTIDVEGFGTNGGGSGLSSTSRPGMVNSTSATPWVDTDKDAFRGDYYLRNLASSASSGNAGATSGTDGFVMAKIVEMGMRNVAATSDEALVAHCAAKMAMDFQLRLSEIVGKGIPLMLQAKMQAERKNAKQIAFASQYIKGDELKGLMRAVGMGEGIVMTIISGLSTTPDVMPLGGGDFAVPLQSVMTWKGPRAAVVSAGGSTSQIKSTSSTSSATTSGRTSVVDDVEAARARNQAIPHQRFNRNPVYNLLMGANEGAALDFAFAAYENMKNGALRSEFVYACRGVVKAPQAIASSATEGGEELFLNALYDRYCEGLWVPTFAEATHMFVNFLKKCQADPKMMIEYFNFRGEQQGGSSRNGSEVSGLNKRRFVNIPFAFDNVAIETLKARQMAKRLQELPPNFIFLQTRREETAASDAADGSAPASKGVASTIQGLSRNKAAQASAPKASSADNAINTQNYFDSSESPMVTAIDQDSVSALSSLLHSAFPTSTSVSSPSGAPKAPGSTYSGPFNSFLQSPMVATKVFREWCDTVFPLLPAHYRLIENSRAAVSDVERSNKYRSDSLKNILDNESNEQLERDFRQNAERYWRRIIDGGRSMENLRGGQDTDRAGGEFGAVADRQSSGGNQFSRRPVGMGRGGSGQRNYNSGNARSFSNSGNNNRAGGQQAPAGASAAAAATRQQFSGERRTSGMMSTARGGRGRGGRQ